MVDIAAEPRDLPIIDTRPQWFGHPAQLARLFTTELWERFGFYGMRALLVLYLTQHFIFNDRVGSGMYGAYMSLVYLTPFIGGLLADRYLGSKRAVKFGALVMSAGYLMLCFGGDTAQPFATFDGVRHPVTIAATADGSDGQFVTDAGQRLQIKGRDDGAVDLLAADGTPARTIPKAEFSSDAVRSPFYVALMLVALSLIVIGNGFFKPNISTMVGSLYAKGDQRRDAGFTIFYMGINLGSLGSQILCPFLAVAFGWWAGFGLAALGMLVAWALIQFDGGRLAGYGEVPAAAGPDRSRLIYLLSIAAVVVPWLLFSNTLDAPAPVEGQGIAGYLLALPVLGKALFLTFIVGLPAILVWSYRAGSKAEFQMMLAAMVLIVFNVTFWTLFEQAGSSLTLFADRNTNLSVFGLFSISAGQTQFFNALFIVLLAPLFSAMWTRLAARGLEPGIPVKFGIALIGVGLGFLFLVLGTTFAGPDYKVGLWWLAGLYLIHSMAELCISPVGLSMITKLSIARIVGMMMGVWFLSISVAQYVGGIVAQVASVETVGGEVTNLSVSLATYAGVFQTIGIASAIIGGVLLLLSPFLKRWMHGVR
ncbi:peptide MFS transporter [Polymorphobacter fuscus]|uniref:peptide MFS transporter n=1 Tax=Sandarakinorhabdus fusca TaxID=1439888 RepID=UPI0016B9C9A6|nr:peptide MFS transporter [Polymorphobacter fuscus]NJC09268.1 POT family proton-dependent oligopeptide transporter [Polymorphobacter fuscus]